MNPISKNGRLAKKLQRSSTPSAAAGSQRLERSRLQQERQERKDRENDQQYPGDKSPKLSWGGIQFLIGIVHLLVVVAAIR